MPVKQRKIEDLPRGVDQFKDTFYQEKYQIIRQTYCSEEDYQKKKNENRGDTHKERKNIYEYEKYEKKKIII
jgi:hypothetical protein